MWCVRVHRGDRVAARRPLTSGWSVESRIGVALLLRRHATGSWAPRLELRGFMHYNDNRREIGRRSSTVTEQADPSVRRLDRELATIATHGSARPLRPAHRHCRRGTAQQQALQKLMRRVRCNALQVHLVFDA